MSRWFAAIDSGDGTVLDAVVDCLGQLADMLDTVRPTRVDRRRCTIRGEGHGWTLRRGVEVRLAHATDREVASQQRCKSRRTQVPGW